MKICSARQSVLLGMMLILMAAGCAGATKQDRLIAALHRIASHDGPLDVKAIVMILGLDASRFEEIEELRALHVPFRNDPLIIYLGIDGPPESQSVAISVRQDGCVSARMVSEATATSYSDAYAMVHILKQPGTIGEFHVEPNGVAFAFRHRDGVGMLYMAGSREAPDTCAASFKIQRRPGV